jgi:hypothetical protein
MSIVARKYIFSNLSEITRHTCKYSIFSSTVASDKKWTAFVILDTLQVKFGRNFRSVVRPYKFKPQNFAAISINCPMDGKPIGL